MVLTSFAASTHLSIGRWFPSNPLLNLLRKAEQMIIYTNMDQIKYFKCTCHRFPNSVRYLDFKVAHVVPPLRTPCHRSPLLI